MKRSDTKLTERFVNMLRPPAAGQKFYWDSATRGFGVGITSGGTRTYVAQKRINGKTVRMKIGLHGIWNVEDARHEAQRLLFAIDEGVDPREEKRLKQASTLTLRSVMEDYCANKKTRAGFPLKPRTKADIERHVTRTFEAWADRPVASIKPDDCRKRFEEISATGPVSANQAFRVLRSLLNYVRESHETDDGVATLLAVNPVRKLKWNAEIERETRIPFDKVGLSWNWLQQRRSSARTVEDRTSVELVCFLLLTGARLSEGAELTWDLVKLGEDAGTFHLPNPKNRRAVTLPLNAPARQLLKDRLARRDEERSERERRAKRDRPDSHQFVFASWGKSGHIEEVRKTMKLLSQVCGEPVTAHDMRRTFAGIAEDDAGVPHGKVQQLINHRAADTTGRHYTNNRDPRKLAAASEAIGAWIVEQGALAAGKNVVALRA